MNPSKCRLEPRADLVALDDALNRLAAIDPRKSQVVELRFFGGLTAEEAAEVLETFAAYGLARLEAGQGLAAPRTDRRNAR